MNPAQSLDVLFSQLNRREFLPVYFFYGAEDFLIDEALETLMEEIMKGANRDFDFDTFDGAESDGESIVLCANAFPMLAERRLVIVRHFEDLDKKEFVYSYVEKPSPTTSLVLVSSKADRKILSHAPGVEFRPMRDYELPKWVVTRAQRYGKQMNPDAADLLLNYVGNSLGTLDQEIDKLAVYVGERKAIEEADVAMVAGSSKTFNLFELTKAIGNRDLKRSLEILERTMELGEPPVLIVAVIAKHFMSLAKFSDGQRKKMSQSELASLLRTKPYRLNDFVSELRKYSSADLERSFASLVRADEKLKFTSEDPHSVMTVLLHEIIR